MVDLGKLSRRLHLQNPCTEILEKSRNQTTRLNIPLRHPSRFLSRIFIVNQRNRGIKAYKRKDYPAAKYRLTYPVRSIIPFRKLLLIAAVKTVATQETVRDPLNHDPGLLFIFSATRDN